MTLPNLARISAVATPGPWTTIDDGEDTHVWDRIALPATAIAHDIFSEHNRALIAAAPEMARLLQECADAMICDNMMQGRQWCHWPEEPMCGRCRLLARLADFDRGLA